MTEDDEVNTQAADFAAEPDEIHLTALIRRAEGSTNPLLITLRDYDECSKEMLPIRPDHDVDRVAREERLKTAKPVDFRLVAEIMLMVKNPWRRWTMARFLGEYAGRDILPQLQALLNDPDASVRQEARWAIDDLNSRRKAISH